MKYIYLFFFVGISTLQAQSDHAALLKGTTAYQKGDFETAEAAFKRMPKAEIDFYDAHQVLTINEIIIKLNQYAK